MSAGWLLFSFLLELLLLLELLGLAALALSVALRSISASDPTLGRNKSHAINWVWKAS